jgi:hypothetical protein
MVEVERAEEHKGERARGGQCHFYNSTLVINNPLELSTLLYITRAEHQDLITSYFTTLLHTIILEMEFPTHELWEWVAIKTVA